MSAKPERTFIGWPRSSRRHRQCCPARVARAEILPRSRLAQPSQALRRVPALAPDRASSNPPPSTEIPVRSTAVEALQALAIWHRELLPRNEPNQRARDP